MPTASARRSATARCWSPTAITGTRAGPNRPSPEPRSSRASRSHAHHYREPDVLPGKRVLVLGIGNSAVDIAVESSRIARQDLPGDPPRRLRHPQVHQRQTDRRALEPDHLDAAAWRCSGSSPRVRSALPLPPIRLPTACQSPTTSCFEAHPTVSSELLPRLGHGDIAVKPNIDRFTGGRSVRFVDGSEEEIDLVVYCTGYKMTFPFFEPEVLVRPRQPAAALPPRRLGRASGPLLHRLHPAARPDHAPRRGPVRVGRGPAGGPGRRYRRRRRCGVRSRARNGRCGSATSPLSVIRSRSTSIRICARSSASESRLRSRPDDPGPPARRAGRQRHRGAASVRSPARPTWQLRSRPALEAAVGVLGSALGLGRLPGWPTRRARAIPKRESSGPPAGRRSARTRSRVQCRQAADGPKS